MTMKYRHSNYPADEMKIRKMIWVHSTVWIDLKRIDIIPEITYLMVMIKNLVVTICASYRKKWKTLQIFRT